MYTCISVSTLPLLCVFCAAISGVISQRDTLGATLLCFVDIVPCFHTFANGSSSSCYLYDPRTSECQQRSQEYIRVQRSPGLTKIMSCNISNESLHHSSHHNNCKTYIWMLSKELCICTENYVLMVCD